MFSHSIERLLGEILCVLKSIEAELRKPPSATKLSILFSKSKGENMPLTLPTGDQDTYSILGTKPFLGALLGPGQTLSVVSADTTNGTFTLTPDPTPQPTPVDPSGT